VPKFLDLDLDDRQGSLLQAWMCSHPSRSLPEVPPALAHCGTDVIMVCSAGSQTPITIDDPANLLLCAEPPRHFIYLWGQATATVVPSYPLESNRTSVPPNSDEEVESASIENERIIAFRPVAPEVRQALYSSNVRLSPDAIRFVERAQGRRFRLEEDPELQSE
jgi:hypothetical protein